MKNFWKRKLPAFLLALILAAGLVTPALAAPCGDGKHNYPDTWKADNAEIHSRACVVAGCGVSETAPHSFGSPVRTAEPTCSQEGTEVRTCSACGYQFTTTLPKRSHSYGGWMTKDDQYHVRVCAVCHGEEIAQHTHAPDDEGTVLEPTCAQEGRRTYTCLTCKGRYYEPISATGKHTLDATGRCVVCKQQISTIVTVTFMNGSSVFSTQNISSGNQPLSPGTPSYPSPAANCSYTFKGWTSTDPGAKAVYAGQPLVAPANIAVTANAAYYAVYTVSGANQDVSLSTGTAASVVGGSVRNEINGRFSTLTGRNLIAVSFSSPASSSYGTLYANNRKTSLGNIEYSYSSSSYPIASLYFVPGRSSGYTVRYTARDGYNTVAGVLTFNSSGSAASGEILIRVAPGSTVALKPSKFEEVYEELSGGTDPRYVVFTPDKNYDDFPGMLYAGSRSLTRGHLDESDFCFDSRDAGSDTYELSALTFRADKNAKENSELSIPFLIWYKNSTCEGTLRVVIDKDGMEGDVTCRVAPGSSVNLSCDDFNAAYQDVSGSAQDIRYVEFAPDDAYTSFSGKFSTPDHSDLTMRELSRETFYYSGSGYDGYAIDDLIFWAKSSAKDGDVLEIPFTAYRSKNDYAEGTLRLIVDKNGSQDTVACSVAPGGTVKLDRTAFNKVYQALSGNSRRTISAVSFNAPDSYRNFAGALFADRDELQLADLTHDENWFYYSSDDAGWYDYLLEDLTFQADRDAKEGASLSIPFRAYYDNDRNDYEEGILRITITSSANTITYEAAPGGSVSVSAEDFNRFYQSISGGSRSIRYVAFEAGSDYASFAGSLYAGNAQLLRSSLTYTQTRFYYNSANYGAYALSSLSFRPAAGARDQSALSIPFRAYYDSGDYAQGTLKLVVNANAGGDVAFTVTPGQTVNFDRTKFDDFFRKSYGGSLDYVVFSVPSAADFPDSCGTLYTGYNTSYSVAFSRSSLRDVRFYYNSNDAGRGDYALNDLTFSAASSFLTGKVVLRFTACGTNGREEEGTLVIIPATVSASSNYVGSVRYAVTTGTNVQINANDLARFYKTVYPSGTLQYVTLGGVPSAGALYYNYYSASRYGTSAREQITAANLSRNFYLSPASPSEYALTELTYVPSGSNYCASIPFTAYGAGGQSVNGGILISVTSKAVSEVYGPTSRNTTVIFPAAAIVTAVSSATGTVPSGIQLLKLPAANAGTIYVGNGASTPANTTTVYGYNSGNQQLSQLRFVPQAVYTGTVEIPYVALNASGAAIASGVFSMGVLGDTSRKFTDITASTWCYKYVTELADAAVIDGYSNGSFKPDNTITYGAALKLIMLAAGYPEQAPTVRGSTFSGYLAKAQADGLITRSNVNLSGTITRLQVAQLAAGALKLDINSLSSVKPFTDTADVYVQALNAAGIVEGYFSNGTSTFRPSNTLTRGQVSAIVWRMRNYRQGA